MYSIVHIMSPFHTSALNGGLIIHSELIYELPYISVLYLYKNFELKRGVGL